MPAEITILKNNRVTITNDRLKLVSLNQIPLDLLLEHYKNLLGNLQNVSMFLDGKPWEMSKILSYISFKREIWFNGDPYSTFAIYDLKNNFIGTLNLVYRKDTFSEMGYSNVIEIGIIIDFPHVNKGIGREVANLAEEYIRLTLTKKPEASSTQEILTRLPPTGIIVTVHPENKPSIQLIQRALIESNLTESKMNFFGEYGKGQPRRFVYAPLNSISHESAASFRAKL